MSQSDLYSGQLQSLRTMFRSIGEVVQFDTNDTIFEAGELGESMYLVEQGSVLLVFTEDLREVSLQAGMIFGELTLLLPGHRRSATAMAEQQTMLRRIDRAAFEQLREESPLLLVDLLHHTSAYLLSSEFHLVDELRSQKRKLENALDYLHRTKEELSVREIEALTDSLTGIYNRRCFEEHLRRYSIEKQGLALIIVDLDHFKSVNDRFGHAAGDLVLKKVAESIKDSMRHVDLPCRIGGDEFAALIQEASEEDCLVIAKRIYESIGTLDFGRSLSGLSVSASIGGGRIRPGETGNEFFERVDREQLYSAKESGRNILVWEGEKMATAL